MLNTLTRLYLRPGQCRGNDVLAWLEQQGSSLFDSTLKISLFSFLCVTGACRTSPRFIGCSYDWTVPLLGETPEGVRENNIKITHKLSK